MRPIASLSPMLLARKGQARPAMRPQTLGAFGATPPAIDDLGWNDMGASEPVAELAAADLPPVLVERAALAQEVVRIVPDPVDPSMTRTAAPMSAGRAAFTLRLPADRHLRLRLASAVCNRSAQRIVTEALDAFLSTLPEVEELARRCSPTAEPEDRS